MEIRPISRTSMTDAEAVDLARLMTLCDPRRPSTDEAVTVEIARDSLRSTVPTYAHNYWGLFVGDTMIGYAEATGALQVENSDVAEIGVWVDPNHPGSSDHELRRLMFEHVRSAETKRGRTRFWGWGDLHDEATRSFWEDDVGLTLGYDGRYSRCIVADIDHEMLHTWVDRAHERAAGYHLVCAEAPLDDDLIELLAQALEAMNDEPVDDLEIEPDHFDADRAREIERIILDSNSEYRTIFALETATGELAGFTATRVPRSDPAHAKQSDTVTLPEHRNRGIGRWIKAEMIHWLQRDRPEVRTIDTANAESNAAMLSINEAMGFEAILHHAVWHQA